MEMHARRANQESIEQIRDEIAQVKGLVNQTKAMIHDVFRLMATAEKALKEARSRARRLDFMLQTVKERKSLFSDQYEECVH